MIASSRKRDRDLGFPGERESLDENVPGYETPNHLLDPLNARVDPLSHSVGCSQYDRIQDALQMALQSLCHTHHGTNTCPFRPVERLLPRCASPAACLVPPQRHHQLLDQPCLGCLQRALPEGIKIFPALRTEILSLAQPEISCPLQVITASCNKLLVFPPAHFVYCIPPVFGHMELVESNLSLGIRYILLCRRDVGDTHVHTHRTGAGNAYEGVCA